MKTKVITMEQRLKDNIKNYQIHQLVNIHSWKEKLEVLSELFEVSFVVADVNGERVLEVGECEGTLLFDKAKSKKLKIQNKTVAYVYVDTQVVPFVKIPKLQKLFEVVNTMVEELGNVTYIQKEYELYSADLEEQLKQEHKQLEHENKEDLLTGVLNKSYFMNRVAVIERSGVVPVAVICGNINDWKFVNDNYGDEESDRLIKTTASIMRKEARSEYVIGRVDGDVFYILMPLVEEKEVKEYCMTVQEKCSEFEDSILAPSIAFGWVMRNNVEQDFESLFSEAEYIMFEDKFRMKNKSGYEKRLKKGKY